MPRRGGLVGLVGQGIGMAAEYHEHRKQAKLSRENSQQSINDDAVAGPSTRPDIGARAASSPSDPPPSYAGVPSGEHELSLASGQPAVDDKKAAMSQYDDDYDDDDEEDEDDLISLEDDEQDWELDEALATPSKDLDGPPSYEETEAEYRSTEDLVRDVMLPTKSSAPLHQPQVLQPLPCPVIIPQRRPRKKARGFVRAYAPLLGECAGIDQETFLKFLKNFQKSSQASPIFPIIAISAAIAGLAPSAIAMAVSTVVQIGARAGAEIQSRHRTNDFLDRMNQEFFTPKGLFAFIVKYKPDSAMQGGNSIMARFGIRPEVVDMSTNQVVAKYSRDISGESTERSISDRMKNIRLASGTTRGAFQLPEAAPLIFPDVDQAIEANGAEETFKDKAKDAKKFMAGYLDRRAQMTYAQDDPMSSLAIPEEQRAFRSKLGDPSHPMYNGGLVGFVTGGYVNPRLGRADWRFEKDGRRMMKYERRMVGGRDLSNKKQARYDAYMAESERRGLSPIGGQGRRSRSGGRRGLIGSLVGAAVDATSSRRNEPAPRGYSHPPAPYGSSRSKEFEDAADYDRYHEDKDGYQDPRKPHRRSFDDRRGNETYLHQQQQHQQLYDGGRSVRRAQRIGPISMVRRMMREDVIYLMIVNMPTQDELAEARRALGSS